MLQELVYSEMQYHARALETLTQLHQGIASLDMTQDFVDVQRVLRTDSKSPSNFDADLSASQGSKY